MEGSSRHRKSAKTEAILAQPCAYKALVGWARKVLEDYRGVVQWDTLSALGLGEFLLERSDDRLTSENKGPYQVLTPGIVISNLNLWNLLMRQQIASGYAHIFDLIVGAYAQIAEALPRFDRFQKAFQDNPNFQNVLAMVYTDILEFHRHAYKIFKRPGS